MPKGVYKRKYVPGEAAYKRLYTNNHYREKGLTFKKFMQLSQMDCHYCGAKPKAVNPYGSDYDIALKSSRLTYTYWQDCWIVANGVDKMTHQDDYKDIKNLVPCCKICNWMKQRLTHDEFIAHCQKVAAHQ